MFKPHELAEKLGFSVKTLQRWDAVDKPRQDVFELDNQEIQLIKSLLIYAKTTQ
jgi:uncharacterized protein YjcR